MIYIISSLVKQQLSDWAHKSINNNMVYIFLMIRMSGLMVRADVLLFKIILWYILVYIYRSNGKNLFLITCVYSKSTDPYNSRSTCTTTSPTKLVYVNDHSRNDVSTFRLACKSRKLIMLLIYFWTKHF